MKIVYILPVLFLFYETVCAQSEADIVRYTIPATAGSARVAAMGGAFGALGGDLTAVMGNPAGIGVFRKSEISITPFLNVANTCSDNTSIRKGSFPLGSLGGVASLYNEKFNWKGVNIGINYTNLNSFSRKTNQFVYDSPTNFPTVWANQATIATIYGNDLPTDSEMAYNARLIEWIAEDGKYDANLIAGEQVNQHQYIVESGSQGEYDFSLGTNFKDKLYLGLTIGIQSIRYKYRSYYTEVAPKDSYYEIDNYDYNQYLKTEGVGTNFKVGILYRPIPALRIGAAIHSPTFYSITDTYEANMESRFFTPDEDGNSSYYTYLPAITYNYDMKTPWKAIFSLATVLGQKAIVSVDYEFNNYRPASFNDGEGGYDYAPLNQELRTYLKNTNNVRIGAEYRTSSTFSLRAGYAYWASPYRYTQEGKIQSVSGGFGVNLGVFYCDMAYIYKFAKNTTAFYNYIDPEDAIYNVVANPVHNKYQAHEAKITLGVRF